MGNVIKFRGEGELDRPLEHNKTYTFAVEAEVTDGGLEPTYKDEEDDRIWKAKVIKAAYKDKTGEVVKFEGAAKRHIKQYRAIYHYFQDIAAKDPLRLNMEMDFDKFYDSLEAFINSHIPEIVEVWKETHSNG